MRKRFIKVMLFGALTLTAGASFVGCKDYDDDVKNLQEQIDKVTATSPVSTEEMKAAIAAAKVELQAEVEKLKASAADKTVIAALETKITELQGALEKADKEAAAKIAAELATAKNDLKLLIDGNATKIATLEAQIAKLGGIETRLAALEAAQNEFIKTGDLAAYTKTADMAKLINSEIANALGEKGAIAAYVNNAITTQAVLDAAALGEAVSKITGVETSLSSLKNQIAKDNKGIIERLSDLEAYDQAIKEAIAESSEGKDTEFADVLKSLIELKDSYYALIVPEEFASKVNDALEASLKDADSEFAKLTATVKQHGIDIEAIKAMVQSVVFVPEYTDGQVKFTSLFAKGKKTSEWLAISKSDAVQVKFRVSPVSAAAQFLNNYNISLDAQEIKTRAAAAFDIVEGTTVDATTGMIIMTLKANTEKSYAVSLNIKSKTSEKTTVATDISSNYFPIVSVNNYLHSAIYKMNDAGTTVDNNIIYNDAKSVADYSTGKIYVEVGATKEDTHKKTIEFNSLGVSGIFSKTYTVDNTLFNVNDGKVTLKTPGQTSSINATGLVKVNLKLMDANFTVSTSETTLGTVKVIKATTGKDVTLGTKTIVWSNGVSTIAADKFDINTICNANGITKNEYADLTATPVNGDIKFVIGTDNALSATVAAGKKAGEYPITVNFSNDDKSIAFDVTATVKVVYPTLSNLAPDTNWWGGSATDGTVTLSPTLDNDAIASSITLSQNLTKLFSNYEDVKAAVTAAGGSLAISVPNVDEIQGLSYANPMLSYDKNTFTGYLADGKTKAVVKVKAEVKFGAETTQTLNATISIANISGSWIAPTEKSVTLNDKAATVDLSKGFQWNDSRKKPMWKDGKSTVGDSNNGFGERINALNIYGLKAPKFVFFDKVTNKEINTDKYLTLSDNKISFTPAGKAFVFVKDYEVTVKVVAQSQWGVISGYSGNEYITVKIPAAK